MPLSGTIVAIASPPGGTERAVVRLSGGATRPLLDTLLRDGVGNRARGAWADALDVGLEDRLPVLVLWMPGPRSYTGEDSAELLCVGGVIVPQAVVRALLDGHPGTRHAEAGEFSARAFLNGRMSAEEAEGVRALIASRSEEERRGAQRLVAGETTARYRAIADDLASALALVEAGIDFTEDDDVVAIAPDELERRVSDMLGAIGALVGPERSVSVRTERARVVLAGAPSAGKSTLFNRLLGRHRAVVHHAPGTTRDTLVEPLTIDGGRCSIELADIAGLDEAMVSRSEADAGAQALALRALEEADVILWCDPTGRFEAGAFDLRPLARETPLVRVRTKCDVGAPHRAGLSVCALDGTGVRPLERAIADACALGERTHPGAVVARHEHALRDARAHLDQTRRLLDPTARSLGRDEEIAGAMRLALDALAPIAGAVHPDDVIGRIFASFCVGK